MPWRETSVQEERLSFVRAAKELGRGGFAGLCREYGISRPTGYLWVMDVVEDCSGRSHRAPIVIRERSRKGW